MRVSDLPRREQNTHRNIIDVFVDSHRHGPGRIDHALTLKVSRDGASLWTREATIEVDAPFEVADLANVDPFAIASLFPAMTVGGLLRIHGHVSYRLLRNLLDYQSAWRLANPNLYRPVVIEPAGVDYAPKAELGHHRRAILAFGGGVDSTLALCLNASKDKSFAHYDIGATLMIIGINSGPSKEQPEDVLADLRRISAAWDVPTARVHLDVFKLYDKEDGSIAAWVAASLSLFSGSFDVGLTGATGTWLKPTYDTFGTHPLLDPLLSSGHMAIRCEGASYERAEKIKLLSHYAGSLDGLRVCFHSKPGLKNCCRCEKCIRTMLCCIAAGQEVPSAFPLGLRLQDIGIGMGNSAGLIWASEIIASAERWGTSNHPAMRRLRRRYRAKRAKVALKNRLSQILPRKSELRERVQ